MRSFRKECSCFLVGGEKYVFILTGKTAGGTPGNAKREVTANNPPDPGQCTAEPRNGKPCEAIFTLTCSGFTDPDKPLQYEFFYSKDEESKNETLGSGFEAKRSRVAFPSGLEKNEYRLTLYAKVSDSLGASKMFKFESQIKVIHRWR